MRAVAGEAALEVGVDALGQLGGQPVGVGRAASAAGSASSAPPVEPELRRRARRSAAQPLDGARRGRPSARRRGGRARRPRRQRARAPARPARIAREQRVALRERRARRRGASPARAGHSAATTWSRCARRSAGAPLHQLEPVGQEDADQRPRGRRRSAARRARRRRAAASARRARSRPRCVRAVVAPRASSSSRVSAGAEAHDLALVRRPARAAGAAEVERLEQVRLAGAVAARETTVRPGAEPHLRRARRSGSRAGAGARPARRAAYTFRRIGMIR